MDVLPSATHLTAMSLSSFHPDIIYRKSNIHLVPLGCNKSNNGKTITSLGSLELLDDEAGAQSLFGRRSDLHIAATDNRVAQDDYLVKIDAGTCDLIIMNPPYGRATKHSRLGAEHSGVTRDVIPPFAAFGASPQDQKEMSDRLKQLSSKISKRAAHGNAGLGSYFFDLAHAKLRPGGVLAIILPLTAATGKDWEGLRNLLESHYDNITFVGLAGATDEERQFSADTGLAELLLIAKRRTSSRSKHEPSPQVRWVTLYQRPKTEVESIIDARLIAALYPANGETAHLRFGQDIKGRIVAAGINDGGLLAIRSDTVLNTAMNITRGSVYLQRFEPIPIPISRLEELGQRGPIHRDVAVHRDRQSSQTDRAPFFIDPPPPLGTDPFPLLWTHDVASGRESRLEVQPDSSGTIRPEKSKEARTIFWDHAVCFHINQDFDFGSQRLAACITPEKTLGGTAWPGYKLYNIDYERFLVLWMNTTLGLICFWITGSRQQKRRSRITVTRQAEIPVYDPRSLTAKQLEEASDLYEQIKMLDFKPANQAHEDANRKHLDRVVLCDLLGLHTKGGVTENYFLEALGIVRAAWCDDPHIKRR